MKIRGLLYWLTIVLPAFDIIVGAVRGVIKQIKCGDEDE